MRAARRIEVGPTDGERQPVGQPTRVTDFSIEPEKRLTTVVVVVGPTASGKSALALHLAERWGAEIVGCDSVQVYRGLDIGSAKTPVTERRGIAHHLIDCVPVSEEMTAGEYARRARAAIEAINSRQRLAVVVGGTGLYLRALLEGLSAAPQRNEGLRAELKSREARRPGLLHRFLRRFDCSSAAAIHPRDKQKLIRAVELSLESGQTVSALHAEGRTGAEGTWRVLKLGLAPPRDLLRARIEARTAAMFAGGLVEETRAFLDLPDTTVTPPALRTLGYRQAIQYLRGELGLDAAIADTTTKTRQYAKRQMTWFRQDREIVWIDQFGDSEEAQLAADSYVESWMQTAAASLKA